MPSLAAEEMVFRNEAIYVFMAKDARACPELCPAAITIHNDSNVFRKRVCERLRIMHKVNQILIVEQSSIKR